MTTDFTYYISGHDVSGYLDGFDTAEAAADYLYDYITGEVVENLEIDGEDEAADEESDVEYSEILAWIREEIKTGSCKNVKLLVNEKSWDVLEELVYNKTLYENDGMNEWLSAGDYDGDETIESLAAEWDALCEANNAINE